MTSSKIIRALGNHALFAPLINRTLASLARWVAGLLLVLWQVPAMANDLAVGRAAPPITLTVLDGQRVATDDLRGKVVIVTFWATWCEPCREELPLLSQFAKKHAQDGLVVLGFSLDTPDQLDKVRAIAHTLSFPVGLLGDPHVAGYGRIWRLPVSFTIDREGKLADNGWKDSEPAWTQQSLDRIVLPLLRPSSPSSPSTEFP